MKKLLIDLKAGQPTGTASFRLQFLSIIDYNGKCVKSAPFLPEFLLLLEKRFFPPDKRFNAPPIDREKMYFE